jgi:hypothetical protein
MSASCGNSSRSHVAICCGDQRNSSRASTTVRSAGRTASFAGFGRRALSAACRSARTARYRRRPPFAATSRDTVEGDR